MEHVGKLGTAVMKLTEEGLFKKVKLHNYSLADVPAQLKTLKEGKTTGKIIITVNHWFQEEDI